METVNYTVSKIRSGTVSAFSVYFKYEVVKALHGRTLAAGKFSCGNVLTHMRGVAGVKLHVLFCHISQKLFYIPMSFFSFLKYKDNASI